MIEYFAGSGHRIGVYWLLSMLLFGWFLWLGGRRFAADPNRLRLSIVAFAASWMAMCGHNALFRFGAIAPASASSWEAETIRIACCASLTWLCWEFRSDRQAHLSAPDNVR